MKPEIWGPHSWKFLHYMTISYPECPSDEDKQNMSEFINAFQKIIPCYKCRTNFKKHIQEQPLNDSVLKSKKDFVYWMIDVHNSVNKLNNKPIMSYGDALSNLLYTNKKTDYANLIIFVIIMFMLVIALIVAIRMQN